MATLVLPGGLGRSDKFYGVPFGTAFGGGVLYNKPIFDKLGLSVPKTWAEFMANNKKIKAAGVPPVIQSYKDTWTSQLFVLATSTMCRGRTGLRRAVHGEEVSTRPTPP